MIKVSPETIRFNRNTLAGVKRWIEKIDYQSPPSIFNYGLPEHVMHLIDLPISDQPTEVDIICELARSFEKLNYLEIGVSVGKTFYQVHQFCRAHLRNARFACLDIEDPNMNFSLLLSELHGQPKIEKRTVNREAIEFNAGLDRKSDNIIYRWGNQVSYHAGNEFDPGIWLTLKEGMSEKDKFNLVFSDAYHAPIAILFEYQQLKKNELLDYNNLIYCFDDLDNSFEDGPMWAGVKEIYEDIKKHKPNAQLQHLVVNGWLGQHEYAHNFGLIY